MSLFEKLSQHTKQPVMAVIAGEQGLGKTSLGALMPKPVMIRTEDGASAIEGMDVQMFPVAKSIAEVYEQIKMLATEDHDFKTLLVDSTTAFDSLAVLDVQTRNKTANLSACDGGFGGGYHTVRAEHEKLLNRCKRLSDEKRMNIIFISHVETEDMNPPDAEAYTRYNIQLTKTKSVDCSKVYTNNCDLVAFMKMVTYVVDGKAKSDGSRIITCYPSAAHVSKNRYKITEDIPFEEGVNPFNGIIKQLTTKTVTKQEEGK